MLKRVQHDKREEDAERGKCKVYHDMNSCVYWVILISEGEDRNLFERKRKHKFLGEGMIDKFDLLWFRLIYVNLSG